MNFTTTKKASAILAIGFSAVGIGILSSFFRNSACATDCNTDCRKSCTTSHNVPCPTTANPFKMCRATYVDPACNTRCNTERAIHCQTGINSCDLWRSHKNMSSVVSAIEMSNKAGLIKDVHDCHKTMNLANTGVSAGSFVADALKHLKIIASSLPTGTVQLIEHGSHCACNLASYNSSSSQSTAGKQNTSSDGRHVAWSNNLGDRITSHREMPEGSFLQSGDGRWKMVVQGDGNLVVYKSEGNVPIWSSNTAGVGAYPFKLAVQSDGNVVIYGTNTPTWATNTNGVGTGPYTLVMQDDANLVLYDRNGSIWATNTCCR